MKKTIIMMTLAFLVSLYAVASAGASHKNSDSGSEVMTGTVVFMSKNSLTIKDDKTHMNRTVDITVNLMSGLENGDKIKIILQKNSNLAQKVTKIKSKLGK